MSKLVIERLKTILTQDFTVTSDTRLSVHAFTLYLYMHGAPVGTFTLSLKDGAEVLASKDFTSADIKADLSTTDNFGYIHKSIIFQGLVQLTKKTYTLELSSAGYTFDQSSFLSWVREHDNIFNTTDGLNDTIDSNPMTFRIYHNRRV